jgi:hypothetical protein
LQTLSVQLKIGDHYHSLYYRPRQVAHDKCLFHVGPDQYVISEGIKQIK